MTWTRAPESRFKVRPPVLLRLLLSRQTCSTYGDDGPDRSPMVARSFAVRVTGNRTFPPRTDNEPCDRRRATARSDVLTSAKPLAREFVPLPPP